MTITSNIQNKSVSTSRSTTAAGAATRLNYIDTLRAILITAVIALHTAITYGAIGSWTFVDPVESDIAPILLTFVTTVVQAFSLGLYFFLSGNFTPRSYDKKGVFGFWKDRLLRLGIPLLVYTFVLSRIPTYIAGVAEGYVSGSFWKYFASTFITEADEGPTWFIFALLLFLVGYTLWRLVTRSLPESSLAWTRNLKVPGKAGILLFGLSVSILMFIVGIWSPINNTVELLGTFNFMVIFFVQYILFFIAGILAYRNDWMARFNGKDLRFWAWLTLGVFLMLPVLFFVGGAASGDVDSFTGGLHWQSAAFMLWIGIFSVSISMTLILWLRDRKKPTSRMMAFAGPNSYGVYLIHPLILVPIAVAVSYISLSPLLKYVIVLPLVVVVCFVITDLLRRIPGVKSIL